MCLPPRMKIYREEWHLSVKLIRPSSVVTSAKVLSCCLTKRGQFPPPPPFTGKIYRLTEADHCHQKYNLKDNCTEPPQIYTGHTITLFHRGVAFLPIWC